LRLDFQESAKTLGFVFFASGQQAGSFLFALRFAAREPAAQGRIFP
jgi:hypothetical protein